MQLDSTAFLAGADLIQALSSSATALDCTQERQLFHQGDVANGLYILHAGSATVSMASEEGIQILCFQAGSGSLLGLPGLIGNHPYSLTVSANAGSRVDFLSQEKFTALMVSDPQLSLKILQVLAAEVRTARMALTL
ncbi:Crp/Fnr family transcriptional regulator [Telmatobacter bradus]|uniref:Crp/Fnr family transcriptional regulator n=1 Tax=Telmatobacter bradus TaxID=474953 RepID=UPI003B428842